MKRYDFIDKISDHRGIAASLFPHDVLTLESELARVRGHLYPEEAQLMSRARSQRKQEFLAGRLLARRLLAQLGIHDFPLLIGKYREPLWPAGIVGSISHTKKLCAVAVARCGAIESLGLDLECVADLEKEMWHDLFTCEEQNWLKTLPEKNQRKYAALCFSAKECYYKCQFTLSHSWVNFKDAQIHLDLVRDEFEVEPQPLQADILSSGTPLSGRFQFHDGLVYTGMVHRA